MNTCKVSLQCESSGAISIDQLSLKSSHTQSTYELFHQCVFSDVLSSSSAVKNSLRIKNMNVVSPLNELSGDPSGLKPTKMFFHIDHIHAVSLQCGSSCVSEGLMIV